MTAPVQVTEEPLSEEDMLLLRRGSSGRSLTAVFAGLMFLLLASSAWMWLCRSGTRSRGRPATGRGPWLPRR